MIVVDASWVIALRDPNDEHHSAAAELNQTLGGQRVLLPALTFAECLVAPAKLGTLADAAAQLRAAFTVVEADSEAPLRWASLRAETGLRLPDTIVLDTALHMTAQSIAAFDSALNAKAIELGLDRATQG